MAQSNFSLKNEFALISGATRGIGRQLAVALAEQGAHVIIIGKTKDPHPKLSGTLNTVKSEIEQRGGQCTAIQADVRSEESVAKVLNEVSRLTHRLAVLINNAGSVQLGNTLTTDMKRFDLIQQINVRGAFLMTKSFHPLLKAHGASHVLNISPPIELKKKWLSPHLPYTLSKFGLSMMTMAWSGEFKTDGIKVNSLWPKTLIETAAMNLFEGIDLEKDCRTADIVSDAALSIFSSEQTGQWFLDEEVLKQAGVKDFSKYQRPGAAPKPDLYVEF